MPLCVIALALSALVGCPGCPERSKEATLYVAPATTRGNVTTFIPTGYGGWVPGSKVEILILAEPQFVDGEISSTTTFRSVGTVTVDVHGLFGFGPFPFQFSVPRNIPGTPPGYLAQPLFYARDTANNITAFFPGVDFNIFWFTGKP